MTLPDFLLARIAEDEALARAVHPVGSFRPGRISQQGLSREAIAHLLHMSPSRALAECETKRRIMERHFVDPRTPSHPMDRVSCAWCDDHWPCEDLCDLAFPYADHPDYRQEWKP